MSLQVQFKQFLSENPRWSSAKVAKKLGLSSATLSLWANGRYQGDNAKIEKAVGAFLSGQAQAGNVPKDEFEFVRTSVVRDLERAARTAEYGEQMRVVIGASGIGKTTAVQYLAKTVPGVIVVEAYQGMTKKAFMQVIAKQCGAIPSGGFTELFHAVVEALRGSERLIIIDEAEHLPVQALDAARRIHDFTRCGVLMVGLPRFYDLLMNRQRDYGYIYNRTGLPVRLKKLNEDDVKLLVDTVVPCNGYAEVFLSTSKGIARDLKTIVFESLRIADENGVSVEDKATFPTIVRKVQQELNRREG